MGWKNQRDGSLERAVFLKAAQYDIFALGPLWETMQYVPYGWLSKLLLKWWREEGLTERLYKDNTWRPGFPWSKADRGIQAIYRWAEEPETAARIDDSIKRVSIKSDQPSDLSKDLVMR